MKRVLIFLLVIFLLIDVLLGISLFNPILYTSVMNGSFDPKLNISSEAPDIEAAFSNKKYVNKKLEELGFWKKGAVRYYTPTKVDRVTVNSLKIVITDKPQSWGQRSDSTSGDAIHYSYGQRYDVETKLMTLLIHVSPDFRQGNSLDSKYSGVILITLYDLVQAYPVDDRIGYDKRALSFLSDFSKNIPKNNFVTIK